MASFLLLVVLAGCAVPAQPQEQALRQELTPACQSQKTKAKREVDFCWKMCPEGGKCCAFSRCGTVDLDKWRDMAETCGDRWSPLWPESTTGAEKPDCDWWRFGLDYPSDESADGGVQ